MNQVAHLARIYLCFQSNNTSSPSMGCWSIARVTPLSPYEFNQTPLTIRQCPFILGGEKHCESGVSGRKTQHNDESRFRIQAP